MFSMDSDIVVFCLVKLCTSLETMRPLISIARSAALIFQVLRLLDFGLCFELMHKRAIGYAIPTVLFDAFVSCVVSMGGFIKI